MSRKILRSMDIHGDIIVTDPIYFVKEQQEQTDCEWKGHKVAAWEGYTDWDECDYGHQLNRLGIQHAISVDTEYGNWLCTVFSIRDNKEQPVSHFTSDSGVVCVALLDEVLKYNPNFNATLNNPWIATYIPAFNGTIKIINVTGKSGLDADIRIYGTGSYPFYSKQTGF